MSQSKNYLVVLVCCLYACVLLSACASDLKQVPYASVYNGATVDLSSVLGVSNVAPSFAVELLDETITLDSVKLWISSKSGNIYLPIAKDGSFHLPLSNELREENPMIVANQAPDALKLTVAYESGKRKREDIAPKGKVRYSLLMSGFTVQALSFANGGATPDQIRTEFERYKGIRMELTSNKDKNVVIHSKNAILITPDAEGKFVFPFSIDLMKDDPWVTVPGRWTGGGDVILHEDEE
jgi:hypothetical protein